MKTGAHVALLTIFLARCWNDNNNNNTWLCFNVFPTIEDFTFQIFIVNEIPIFFRYVGINIGSPSRADLLRAHWSFTCQCKRCMDPTELKTFSSAIRCNTCGLYDPLSTDSTEGLLLPSGPVPGASSKWACTSCSASMDKAQVEVLLEEGLRIIRLALWLIDTLRKVS